MSAEGQGDYGLTAKIFAVAMDADAVYRLFTCGYESRI